MIFITTSANLRTLTREHGLATKLDRYRRLLLSNLAPTLRRTFEPVHDTFTKPNQVSQLSRTFDRSSVSAREKGNRKILQAIPEINQFRAE